MINFVFQFFSQIEIKKAKSSVQSGHNTDPLHQIQRFRNLLFKNYVVIRNGTT